MFTISHLEHGLALLVGEGPDEVLEPVHNLLPDPQLRHVLPGKYNLNKSTRWNKRNPQ